jgi:hypothetical protein
MISNQEDPIILKESGKRIAGSLKYLDAIIRENMSKFGVKSDLEGVLVRYYHEVHVCYSYVEQFLVQHEIKKVMERTAMAVSRAAIEHFAKEIPEGKRIEAIGAFKREALKALVEMADTQIDLTENETL